MYQMMKETEKKNDRYERLIGYMYVLRFLMYSQKYIFFGHWLQVVLKSCIHICSFSRKIKGTDVGMRLSKFIDTQKGSRF